MKSHLRKVVESGRNVQHASVRRLSGPCCDRTQPTLRSSLPSVPAVSLALAAPRQLPTLLFSVANKPVAVCAWLVLGAAVPSNLYRLKSDKRNLDWRIVCCFIAPFLVFSLLPCGKRGGWRCGFDLRIPNWRRTPHPPPLLAEERRLCVARSIAVWKAAVPSLKS